MRIGALTDKYVTENKALNVNFHNGSGAGRRRHQKTGVSASRRAV